MGFEIEDYYNEFVKLKDQRQEDLDKRYGLITKTGKSENKPLAVFKLVKDHWTTTPHTELGNNGIFFGMWIESKDLKKMNLSYGVHQLKLKELGDYKIKPGEFVDEFRMQARKDLNQLPNVQIDIGPVYLYRGSIQVEPADVCTETRDVIESFVKVSGIVDGLLSQRRRC